MVLVGVCTQYRGAARQPLMLRAFYMMRVAGQDKPGEDIHSSFKNPDYCDAVRHPHVLENFASLKVSHTFGGCRILTLTYEYLRFDLDSIARTAN
ncbi:MAG: hypothetical protein EA399_12710 [Desulfovibrionales bacterium]|nr:MAG: hypothetical protein EA399_12710 [Desulfovibrionales bacterium]